MKNALRSSLPILCLALCLSACSLQDHVNPEKIKFNTIPLEFVSKGIDFNIKVDSLGEIPVAEYGILHLAFFRAQDDHDYIPRIEHGARIKFDNPMVLGLNKFNYQGDAFSGRYFFYYRSYAILSNGSVIYGDILDYTF